MNQAHTFLKIAKAASTATGVVAMALGGLAGIFYAIQILRPGSALDGATAGAACLALGLGLGGALAWQGNGALRQRLSGQFNPPSIWFLLLPYLPIVVGGQLLISSNLWPVLTFPPVHVLAAAIPPLAVLAFAGRALSTARIRWREMIVQLAGGAFLATIVAITAEIVIGLMLLLTTVALTALMPGGAAIIQKLSLNLQDPTWLDNPDHLYELLVSPPVLTTLVLVFIILAPIIEELVKPLGVALMSYRRPTRRQAFLWGLAGGAGFALVENLFNTITALEFWGVVMALRLAGTAMHCLGSSLTALGWQDFLAGRRPWKLFGAYSLSVIIHALWNMGAVGVAASSLLATNSNNELALTLGGGIALSILTFLAFMTLVIIIALVVLTYRLRGEPASSLTPPAT